MKQTIWIWNGDKQAPKQYGILPKSRHYFVCRLIRNDAGDVIMAVQIMGFLDLAQAVKFLVSLTKKAK